MYKSLLSVTCKTADQVDFKTPLARYIDHELKQDPLEFAEGVAALSDLRASVCVKAPEAYARGLADLMKYYGLFSSVSSRFPMTPEDRTMTFTWNDTYAAGGLFAKKKSSLADANFEMACTMFNLGALHAQVGKAADLTTPDGQKTGIDMFQKSATYFKALKQFAEAKFGGTTLPSPDLEPALLDALSKVMLAQAQEVVFAKALTMKPEILAKVAKSVSELYGTATEAVGRLSALREWMPHVQCKCDYYYSEAEYRQSIAEETNQKYGPGLCRLREAHRVAVSGAVPKSGGMPFAGVLGEYCGKIKGVLEKAENDMKLIYCESVPQHSSLESVVGQQVVKDDKPLPNCESDEIRGADPFAKLLPLAIKKGQDDYIEQRDTLIKGFRTQLTAVTAECVNALEEMNLPAALQVISNPDTVPKDLLTKSAQVRDAGGAEKLSTMIAALEPWSNEIRDKLDDAKAQIDTEEQEDGEMRTAHGTSKWSRVPSAEQNGKMRAEGFKLQGWLKAAEDGDNKIKTDFEKAHSGIVVVSKTESELKAILPSSSNGAVQRTPSGRDTTGIDELNALMNTLDECRNENDVLLTSKLNLDQKDDDITQQLLAHSDGSVDRASLFAAQLAKFDSVSVQVIDLVTRTKVAITETRRANGVFVASRVEDNASNERQKMLADLLNNAEAFHKIMGNLTEGTGFYTKLGTFATTYHAKVTDFCVARKIEKQSLLADITQAAAAAAAVPAPAPVPAPTPTLPPVPVQPYVAPPAASYAPAAPQPNAYAASAPPAQQQYNPYGAPAPQPGYGQSQQPAYNQYAQPQPQYGQQQQQQQYNPYGGAPPATNAYTPAGGVHAAAAPPGYQQAAYMQPASTNPFGGNPSPPAGSGVPGVNFVPPGSFAASGSAPAVAAARRANSGPAADQWACPACSYFNSMLLPRCEMCDYARP